MIVTNPDFLKGDHLSLKQYLGFFVTNKRFLYSSRWNWWKKTTQFWCIPLLFADLPLLIYILYEEWKAGQGNDWWFNALLLALPFVVGLPLIWWRSYRSSYTSARIITSQLLFILSRYIPEATKIRRLSQCNYLFTWHDLEFEAAYTLIHIDEPRKVNWRLQPCFIICLHFMPDPEYQSKIMDKKGKLLDEFRQLWEAYCVGKESCKNIRIENYSIYSYIRIKDLKDPSQLATTMDQMQYLIQRFKLKPLYLTSYMETEIKDWLIVNDLEIPQDIIAINIGIFQSEDGYFLYLSGSKTYDPEDDDWACNEDFTPEEKYLEIPMDSITEEDWEAFQGQVKGILRKQIPEMATYEKSIFHNRVVTMGFDDGNLIKISDK